jgi:NADH:ubiquinone oxidoreductase subunit D
MSENNSPVVEELKGIKDLIIALNKNVEELTKRVEVIEESIQNLNEPSEYKQKYDDFANTVCTKAKKSMDFIKNKMSLLTSSYKEVPSSEEIKIEETEGGYQHISN